MQVSLLLDILTTQGNTAYTLIRDFWGLEKVQKLFLIVSGIEVFTHCYFVIITNVIHLTNIYCWTCR